MRRSNVARPRSLILTRAELPAWFSATGLLHNATPVIQSWAVTVTVLEPRIARTREVVFAAAIEIVAERGFAGASIEAIAQRAGVARSTIYRNWPTRTDLLLEAVGSEVGQIESLAVGNLRADLVAIVTRLADLLTSERMGSVVASIILEVRHDPELEELRQRFLASRRSALDGVIGEAVARGDLPANTDLQRAGDELAAQVLFQTLVLRADFDGLRVEDHVDRWLERYGANRETRGGEPC
jgi:AcrR family transcriptional regulator